MHFAASSLVGESVADPQKYYVNNLAGTLSLLDAMREAGCNRLVFSSTGAVYGNADSKALPENYACAPINPYGASKWMIERVLADYRAAYGLGSFALRYFNASGADPAGGIGELRDVETHLIPRAMMALQGHVADFAVFGDDYDTPDGTAIRDYIHVTDLAAAHVLALEAAAAGTFRRRPQSRHRQRAFRCARSSRRSRPRPAAKCRMSSSRAAPAIRPIWSRMLPPRAQDIELPPSPFGPCDHHPHRLGLAQEGSPARRRVSLRESAACSGAAARECDPPDRQSSRHATHAARGLPAATSPVSMIDNRDERFQLTDTGREDDHEGDRPVLAIPP